MNTKTTPKDFFLHLGATIALYASAIALINLAFSSIDYALPDSLAGYFSTSSIAWPISMLIILVPLTYILEWFINKDIALMPEKKDIWIRRWRIYLTLFLTGALIVGDLITLINTYVNGEITARFVWKVVAILLVAGTIGKYYFYSIYERSKWTRIVRRFNAWFGIVLVVVAIVCGFVIVGSPASQRALRFDSQRVSDLSVIQGQVVNYWLQQGKMPASLSDLEDSISGFKVPTDPETKAPYEYSVKAITAVQGGQGGMIFSLCANFSRASKDGTGRGGYGSDVVYPAAPYYPGYTSDTWDHAAGHVCFDRNIDPTKYPVNKPVPLK